MASKSIFDENNTGFQKEKALKALAKAKAIERQKLKNGKRYYKVDYKTYALR